MSGVELIVGAVLGSMPVAIEVYDRSCRVFEVFSAFKQYPREVSILDARLNVQRTIFRNNAINLLNAITKDQASVLEAINRSTSAFARPDLTMAPVYQNRIDALRESFGSCAQTAEQILLSLQLLCSQSDNFRVEVGARQDDIRTSEWLKHVKTRFRLALSKPKMEEAITELRELNRDFSLITEQIIKHLQQVSNEGSENKCSTRRPTKSLNMLQRYHRVRYASTALYSTLQVQWNCGTHQYHAFDVRIIDSDRGKDNGKAKAASSRYVTCELAVSHDDSLSSSKGPLHLEIQQACDSDDEEPDQHRANTSVHQLTQVLETSAERLKVGVSMDKESKVQKSRSEKSRVQKFIGRFTKEKQNVAVAINATSIPQLPNLAHSTCNFRLSDQSTQPSTSSSTHLSLIDDICKTAYNSVACCNEKSFLGSWSGPHAEWFCVPAALSAEYCGSQALSDIIQWVSEEPVLRSLPRTILVELAGNVAEGIMQFYSTPWLASSDLGQNVRYFCPKGSSPLVSPTPPSVLLKGPYFTAQFNNKTQPQGDVSSGEGTALYHKVHFLEARNELLFKFGILMLEIGYARPWNDLKQAVTASYGELSDYKIAEKLAGQLVNQLGLTYPKIIKKCLGCDFGLGETDMDNEDLQRRFLEDVVAGLQQLKDYMAEMNIAPLG